MYNMNHTERYQDNACGSNSKGTESLSALNGIALNWAMPVELIESPQNPLHPEDVYQPL